MLTLNYQMRKPVVYATPRLPIESTAESPSGSFLLGERSHLLPPLPPVNCWVCFSPSLGLSAYIYSLDGVTTWSYLAFATSTFGNHSLIASIQTAQSIIGKSRTILFHTPRTTTEFSTLIAIGKHVVAKISDVTSRPFAYVVTGEFSKFYLMACPP